MYTTKSLQFRVVINLGILIPPSHYCIIHFIAVVSRNFMLAIAYPSGLRLKVYYGNFIALYNISIIVVYD